MEILLSLALSSCAVNAPDPAPPHIELNSVACSVTYGDAEYKANITHIFQGVTTIAFTQPQSVDGLICSFSGNGCEITLDGLSFKTESSFLPSGALPQIVDEILTSAQCEGALTFTDSEEPNASTLTTATFSGKSSRYSYEIVTDFGSGEIREISVPKCDLNIKFANR